jgi:phosphoribosylformylglycinamidine cyclo-ligase
MRSTRPLRYVVDVLPPVPAVLSELVRAAGMSLEEAYGTFNMGAGFAIYVPASAEAAALAAAERAGSPLLSCGRVENGPRSVVVEPLGITFDGSSLAIR